MLTKEEQSVRATVSIRVAEPKVASEDSLFQAQPERAIENEQLCGRLFEFAGNAPVTFAERFPRLMVGAVAIAFVMAAITVEIECLRGAGFYWR